MEKTKFTVKSTYDGLEISGEYFAPEGTPKGIFEIVHGMSEHKERYEDFMREAAANGFVAVAHDHRGHGESIANEDDLGYFGDLRADAVVDDVYTVMSYMKEQFPGLPVVLYGHSMGSLVVRCFLHKYDKEIDGLIVSGSPSYNPFATAGIWLANTVKLFRGDHHRSKMIADIATGFDDEFPDEGYNAWLSKDREEVEKYNADDKCGFRFTTNGYLNLFRLMKKTYQKGRYAMNNKKLPIFFVAGSDDPVLVTTEKWQKSQQFLRDLGYENVSGKLYQGMRHEIHNEIGKEEVYRDLLDFARRVVGA